jgi:NAD(P) transhydrogenase subunit alpha
VLDEGKLSWPPPAVETSVAPAKKPETKPVGNEAEEKKGSPFLSPGFLLGLLAVGLLALGWKGSNEFLDQITVFVLACFVGYMVVWNVTPSLHTPLMSVTNAISGIILIGGMLFMPTGSELSGNSQVLTWLAGVAIFVATINVAGGFLVTQRMLKMFRK